MNNDEIEVCGLHRDLVDKTEKILVVLEEIKALLIGDIKDPNKIGLVTRISYIEKKFESLERTRNNIILILLKIVGGAAVGGLSLKTIIDILG